MDKKKALLVVAGGRDVPDILALLCVQPQLVAIVTTEEGWGDQDSFIAIAKSLPKLAEILPTIQVASYKFEDIRKACRNICMTYPQKEWDWVFSIGSCPKIMGIAVYELAKEMDVPCIHIDTQHKTIVSLVKDVGISSQDFFNMKVQDYIKMFQREPKPHSNDTLHYRRIVENWGDLARLMILSPHVSEFTKFMRDKKQGQQISITESILTKSALIQDLKRWGAVKTIRNANGNLILEFATEYFARFLGTGDWLELYVYNEVKKSAFSDNYEWGYEIRSTAVSELDGVIIYNAQLILIECKTDANPFQDKIKYLDTLSTKSDMLGRTYVTKVFVTNASKTLPGYSNFNEQAKLREIIVLTGENLPDIGQHLKKQAVSPTYPRR